MLLTLKDAKRDVLNCFEGGTERSKGFIIFIIQKKKQKPSHDPAKL